MRAVAGTEADIASRLTNGASVRLRGTLADSPGAGQAKELKVDEAEIMGECDPEVCHHQLYHVLHF